MLRSYRAILIALLACEILIRMALIAWCGPMTDQGFFGDDSFMSLKFASNIAAGLGITQAGVPTNGFQPLYVFLLVPFYWFLDHHQATVAAAGLLSACSVAAGYFVYLILRELHNVRTGLVGLLLWTVSAHFTRVGLNGLETSLANLMMLVVIYLHLRSKCPGQRFGVLSAISLGLVMGLAMLARLDLGLLLVPLGIDQIRVRLVRRQMDPLGLIVTSAAIVIAPWFIFSLVECGRLTPISGAATRMVAQLYGSPEGPAREPSYFPLDEVPGEYYTSNLAHAGRTLVESTALAIPAHLLTSSVVLGPVVVALVIVLTAFAARNGIRDDDSPPPRLRDVFRRLWYLWVFCGLLIGAYCFYFFAQWHYWRYLTPVAIALLLPSAVLLSWIGQRAARGGRWRWVGIAVVTVLVAGGIRDHALLFGPVDKTGIAARLYADAITIRDSWTPRMKVGSFESGTLDYFIDADIYNLDGKTSSGAYQALRTGTMAEYIHELQLDYVISSPPLIRDLLFRRGDFKDARPLIVQKLKHNVVVAVKPPA